MKNCQNYYTDIETDTALILSKSLSINLTINVVALKIRRIRNKNILQRSSFEVYKYPIPIRCITNIGKHFI